MNAPTRCVSIAEVSDLLGCSERTVRRLIAAGDLPAIQVGRRVAVPLAAYERFVSAHTIGGAS